MEDNVFSSRVCPRLCLAAFFVALLFQRVCFPMAIVSCAVFSRDNCCLRGLFSAPSFSSVVFSAAIFSRGTYFPQHFFRGTFSCCDCFPRRLFSAVHLFSCGVFFPRHFSLLRLLSAAFAFYRTCLPQPPFPAAPGGTGTMLD